MTTFKELMAFQRDIEALGQIAGRLGWDQETVMPPAAGPQRAEEFGALESILHARRSDPRIGDWLAKAEPASDVDAAQLRHIKRSYERATKVPADLASEIARVTSEAQGIWAEARATEDFASFAPTLEHVVKLRQQEADALSAGQDTGRYDALLQDYEPGETEAGLQAMFDALRPRLVALREGIAGASTQHAPIAGQFDEQEQLALSNEIAATFGYDFDHGRIDKAVHPFSSGSGIDVRITTRTSPDDPFNCIYSTIHEVGHASYELGIDRDYLLTPLGAGVSMGVHESQSRIYENQLGRSEAFCSYLYGRMKDRFGDLSVANERAFYGAVNNAGSSFIRTEADEVHYNLHIMLRFDLERALLGGDLPVAELPAVWDERFKQDFGMPVDKPSHGCLQDVHWSVGLIGYFPTYSLGNVYAGCLYQALRDAVPDLDGQLAQGDTSAATGWLKANVQTHGGRFEPKDTIARATGQAPSVEPLLDYIEAKFKDLYDL